MQKLRQPYRFAANEQNSSKHVAVCAHSASPFT